jgi:phage terminase large subunit GpA-like protein
LVTLRDRNGYMKREWQKLRERNEALDCYVYARAAAAASGLDRFEERHWRELERQIGLSPPGNPDPQIEQPTEATNGHQPGGGLAVSGTPRTGRRVIRSRWFS